MAGSQLGPLVLEQELGRSAGGVLYRARHTRYQRTVSARVFQPRESGGRVIEAMQQEAALASRLVHPNIVKVLGLEQTEDGFCCLVSEHLEGGTLEQALARHGALEQELALAIAGQVLQALAYAHSRGVVHRNLTPDDVLLAHHGRPGEYVKLTGFGLAREVAEEGAVVTTQLVRNQLLRGSPWYLAPEALRGDPTDERVDLYAAGMLLYRMLTGLVPFADGPPSRLIERLLADRAPRLVEARPGYPFAPRLQRIVDRAIARPAGRRYQSAERFCAALDRARPRELTLRPLLLWSAASVALVAALFGVEVRRAATGGVRLVAAGRGEGRLIAAGLFQFWLLKKGLAPLPPEARTPPLLPRPPGPPRAALEAWCRAHGRRRDPAEIAAGMVRLPGRNSLIDPQPVTRDEFARFAEALRKRFPGCGISAASRGVTWHEARLYALWRGKELPGEREWALAAPAPFPEWTADAYPLDGPEHRVVRAGGGRDGWVPAARPTRIGFRCYYRQEKQR